MKPFYVLMAVYRMMRRVLGLPQITTYFCVWQNSEEIELANKGWHDNRRPLILKPTDLWGRLPPGIKWEKPKKWTLAPRGSRSGVQGIDNNFINKTYGNNLSEKIRSPELRALIPYGLSLVLCLAAEKGLIEYARS